ncbi:FUSC family protein [Paenibacillus gansuensis]|uniref:Aromatic acid exporter family protein n=1 Tax=Paenibacillus gansuensis TaxID=306542 RepID=A0ABW5P9X0_9BACL
MTLGARVFKTGVAVTLALYASMLLNLSPPIIAAVAALFAMQPSIYRSWRYLLEQLQTNTLGAALALVAGYFFQNDPIAVGVTCIIVIVLCRQLKMEESIGLTLVTVIAVMEAPGVMKAADHILFALNRFQLTIIGIISSFLINILFIPPKPQGQFFSHVQQVFGNLSLLLRTLISNEIKENVFQEEKEKLERSIQSLINKYKLFEEEEKKLKHKKFSDVRLLVVYKQMLNTLHKGYEILETAEQHYFQAARAEDTDADFDQILEKINKYHEHVLLKFDRIIKPDHSDQYCMDKENEEFLSSIMDAYADRKDGRLRLAIVAAAIYDYGFQVSRLDKLVDRHIRE